MAPELETAEVIERLASGAFAAPAVMPPAFMRDSLASPTRARKARRAVRWITAGSAKKRCWPASRFAHRENNNSWLGRAQSGADVYGQRSSMIATLQLEPGAVVGKQIWLKKGLGRTPLRHCFYEPDAARGGASILADHGYSDPPRAGTSLAANARQATPRNAARSWKCAADDPRLGKAA